jgi:hypothetical protein
MNQLLDNFLSVSKLFKFASDAAEVANREDFVEKSKYLILNLIDIKASLNINLDFVNQVIPYPLRRFTTFRNAMSLDSSPIV